MANFDAATSIRSAESPNCYKAQLDPEWRVGDRTNGGYLLALLARAAIQTAQSGSCQGRGDLHPVAAAAHYLQPAAAGPAEIEVAVLHIGRRSVNARATLRQKGVACVAALITCGGFDGEVWWDAVPAPELPDEDTCTRLMVNGPGFLAPLMGVLDERIDPATMGWERGRPSGRGELRGWITFADGRLPDPLSLLVIVDSLPPATFDLGVLGWQPTVELSCHVRAIPSPGPLMVRRRIRHVSGGRVDEICDVWDVTGRLVAAGHQLAGVRVPAPRRRKD